MISNGIVIPFNLLDEVKRDVHAKSVTNQEAII
jgi:hypothetical protein